MNNKDYKEHLYVLILAGGGGTRLWPKSTNKTPKQFLRLFENNTLMQVTYNRFRKILPKERIFCVTVSQVYKNEILKEIPDFIPDNILVEPARRETGPAHGLGAAFIHKKDPDAVIVTEAADRLIKPVSSYLKTLKAAAKVAYEDRSLIAIGVEARYPHTGLGHIKRGVKIKEENGIRFYKLDKFVEKPPLSLAKKYTASPNFYWNAGQYVWRADSLLASLARHAPEIKTHLEAIIQTLGTKEENKQIKSSYESMPKIAIDYAVAEKEKDMRVCVADFFWTDIGDWKEVWENSKKDHMGNVIIDGDEPDGEIIHANTSDALIHTDGRLIAVIDVDNIVVVDTKKALLVCSKSKAQNVKQIVSKLKELRKEEFL